MTVEVIEKKKRGLTCAECGASVSADATECPECGSKSIKKSLVIVRKSVGTEEEIDALDSDELEEEEDLDEEEEEEEEGIVDEDEDLDEEDEEEDEDEDDDDEEDEGVVKSNSLVGLEALNISTAFAEDIAKVFSGKKLSRKKYEAVMTELNNVMDSAADRWFAGQSVSKSKKKAPHIATIQGRVNGIIKHNTEGKNKMPRPKKFEELDDETKQYIESLEGGKVEKTAISKRADLPEDVRKSLEAADKIVEESEQKKWEDVAKSYEHFTGDPVELAKSLRKLSETDEDAFKVMKSTLDAAEEQLKESEIFKSFGRPGSGAPKDVDPAKEEKISKAMEANPGMTREQAEVQFMDASAYQPTA